MRALFILNGSKRKARRIPEVMNAQKLEGEEYNFIFTKHKGDAITLTFENASTYDILVAVGGDGTIHECVNGLMQLKTLLPEKKLPALLPWPMGSGNDFARNFKWTSDAITILARFRKGETKKIDIGQVQFQSEKSIYFVNELSLGLGPKVVELVEKFPRMIPGRLKFGPAIFLAFLFFKKKKIILRSEEFNSADKAIAVVIANGKYFGSGIGIAPEAALNDGLLNLTVIGNISLLDYLKHITTMKQCKKVVHPHVHYHELQMIEIMNEGAIETDGELNAHAPAKIQIIKAALEIM